MKKILLMILFGASLVMHLGALTLGDVNTDYGVTVTDALIIAQRVAGISPGSLYDANAADMNWDGKVDINDALLVAQYCAFGMKGYTVFGFGQNTITEDDQQIYQLCPDMNIRAFQQWSIWGDEASDYNFAPIQKYHADNISYIGGGTTSVIFETDFSPDVFRDFVTRDANNAIVPHNEVQSGAYRASLANPKYRKFVTDYCKIQIDGGVDGIFLDEVIGGFSGGSSKNYNGNEGFDDYCIADFNKYLIEKYPNYTAQDWKNNYRMTDANIIKKDVSPSDLVNNFNYREYLQANGWNGDTSSNGPLTSANPLAKEWGVATNNRMYKADTFLGKYTARYWQEIVYTLRSYAKSKNKNIFITANGIFPFVDFNSLGFYNWNPDEQTSGGQGAEYVPVVNGHLNGSKSLMSIYKTMHHKCCETSGNVPLVTFIDWPCDMMTGYHNLPSQEKKDYWQIFGAEAYACGLYPAFHLKDTVGGPTASAEGVLDFFKTYKLFYKNNSAVYDHQNYHDSDKSVSVNKSNIAQNLRSYRDGSKYALHLINHNYSNGIITQQSFTVTVGITKAPQSVTMLSPDFTGQKSLTYTYSNNQLTINVDKIIYYNAIIIE